MEEMSVGTLVATAGFGLGIIFGAVANKTNFCTMGGVSDVVLMGNGTRFRAWMLAISVAILGTQGLHMLGVIDLTLPASENGPIYLTTNFGWPGAILGGLLFGFGMTRGGGCGNRTLVRIGTGNLKSLVVFMIMGITAYMTLRGIIALGRIQLETLNVDLTAYGLQSQSMIEMVGMVIGVETENLRLIFTLIVGLAIAGYCFKSPDFRTSPSNIFAGIVIGLLIPAGWYVTGYLGADDFEPVQMFSFTFVSPSAASIQYLMTFTGATINFGIATVGGVILGSFLVAIATRSFHIEAFGGVDDLKGSMSGATMMGIGGVIALGCTIGQGLSGMSTLALSSLIALTSIIIGAVWGIKSMEEGSTMGGLKAMLARG